ncbi:hypothetical protein C8R45DRAFT_278790 [Mycena sanguinolenta]|nr:hypothetical protein C8R45DRAFT_278790 [Mycena sanguinolenta]
MQNQHIKIDTKKPTKVSWSDLLVAFLATVCGVTRFACLWGRTVPSGRRLELPRPRQVRLCLLPFYDAHRHPTARPRPPEIRLCLENPCPQAQNQLEERQTPKTRPPPLATELALMQFTGGGPIEKLLMASQAKAAGPGVGVGAVWRDGEGGVWWDEGCCPVGKA